MERHRPLRPWDLGTLEFAALQAFVPRSWWTNEYGRADLRPLIAFVRARLEYVRRLAREEGVEAFVRHYRQARATVQDLEGVRPVSLTALPDVPDTPAGRYLVAYTDLKATWHVNRHDMRPRPLREIDEDPMAETIKMPRHPRFLRRAGGRGNPAWTLTCTAEEVAEAARALLEGPGRAAYRVRRYYREDPRRCYPAALKRRLAREFAVSPRTIVRRLDEAGFEMPEDLVYTVR